MLNTKNKKKNLNPFFIECPHCKGLVQVLAVNCTIFRHGTFIKSGKQMNPHTGKAKCDEFAEKGLINGCGKPFRISKFDHSVTICDYI
jgi:hypothetical protein